MATVFDPKKQQQPQQTAGAAVQQNNAPAQTPAYTIGAGGKPSAYTSRYQPQMDKLYEQVQNRQPFKYDLNGDMLYQNYKDQYMLGGQQAMMDTMGQAAALTGGYGNSYASTAGNQAYQQYLTQMTGMIPQLYDRAANQYNQETSDLLNRYGAAMQADNMEYGRYQDAMGNWQNDRAYNSNIAMMLLKSGQMPSSDLLAAAGLSQFDAQQYLNSMAPQGGGGGGTVTKALDKDTKKNIISAGVINTASENYKSNKLTGGVSPEELQKLQDKYKK